MPEYEYTEGEMSAMNLVNFGGRSDDENFDAKDAGDWMIKLAAQITAERAERDEKKKQD